MGQLEHLSARADLRAHNILAAAELKPEDFPMTEERAMACVRAAYARGYVDAGAEPDPFPLTTADKYRMAAWASLPVA